jgi:hypothetical protein
MPKPRARNQDTPRTAIDAFIHDPETLAATPVDTLEQNAPRKFKTITVPLNEYEYQALAEACRKSGRSAKNLFRYAMLKYAEEISE